MRVRFVTPSKPKQIGGIANAVSGLRDALQMEGIEVLLGGDFKDTKSLHHFHGLWSPSHSILAKKLRYDHLPYVVSPHGMLEPWAFKYRRWKKIPYLKLIERRFLERANSLFVTSKMEAENLSPIIQNPSIKVIPLGCHDCKGADYASARKRLNLPGKERRMLFLSRIDSKKGLDMLLSAMADPQFQWKGWRLVVVGDGQPTYLSSLKSFAEKASDQLPRIDWVGPIWDESKWDYIQSADLFCLPTHSENFGIAVLEALHAGTPVLTTDQTPWASFSDLEGIFISKPNTMNIKETLSAVKQEIELNWSEENRKKLADWTYQKFSWGKIVPKYIEAYKVSSVERV